MQDTRSIQQVALLYAHAASKLEHTCMYILGCYIVTLS